LQGRGKAGRPDIFSYAENNGFLATIRIWEFRKIGDQDLGISISSSSSLLLRGFLTRSFRGRLLSQFQDMDGKLGDFIVAEGHGHPLVMMIVTFHTFFLIVLLKR
jgi:hypothetical protein